MRASASASQTDEASSSRSSSCTRYWCHSPSPFRGTTAASGSAVTAPASQPILHPEQRLPSVQFHLHTSCLGCAGWKAIPAKDLLCIEHVFRLPCGDQCQRAQPEHRFVQLGGRQGLIACRRRRLIQNRQLPGDTPAEDAWIQPVVRVEQFDDCDVLQHKRTKQGGKIVLQRERILPGCRSILPPAWNPQALPKMARSKSRVAPATSSHPAPVAVPKVERLVGAPWQMSSRKPMKPDKHPSARDARNGGQYPAVKVGPHLTGAGMTSGLTMPTCEPVPILSRNGLCRPVAGPQYRALMVANTGVNRDLAFHSMPVPGHGAGWCNLIKGEANPAQVLDCRHQLVGYRSLGTS